MPSFDTEWNIFLYIHYQPGPVYCNRSLWVSPEGGISLDVPVKCKVGVIHKSNSLSEPLVLLSSVTVHGLMTNEKRSTDYI